MQARLAEHAVPFGHWTFLRILWERDGLTQRELSDQAGVMEPSTFAALKAMEKGDIPPGIVREHQHVRSAAVVLPPDKHFKDAAKEALVVQTGKEHVTV